MKYIEFLTLYFLFLALVGIILYHNGILNISLFAKREGLTTGNDTSASSSCPDLLIQDGEEIKLYNTKAPKRTGVNPMIFSKLSEYAEYVKTNPSCPVLYLQKGETADGKTTYNVRSGTPMNSGITNGYDQTAPIYNNSIDRGGNTTGEYLRGSLAPTRIQDKPYSDANYGAFDPYGFNVGRFTDLDNIPAKEASLPVSASPDLTNWGGVEYTEQQVKSGVYIENEVYKPVFSQSSSVARV